MPATKGGHPDDGPDQVVVGRERVGVHAGPLERVADGRLASSGGLLEPPAEGAVAGVDVELLAGLRVLDDERPMSGSSTSRGSTSRTAMTS